MRKNNLGLGAFVISVIVIFLLLSTGCAILTAQWFVNKCFWWDCAPKRTFTVFDLNIPEKYFPVNAQIDSLSPDRGIITAVEEATATTRWINGVAIYHILRFGTENQAIKWFKDQSNSGIFLRPAIDSEQAYLNQDILNYPIAEANEYRIKCGDVTQGFRCIFEGRYEEFYIFFSSSIGKSEISDQGFMEIMNYIDTKMGKLLHSGK